MSCGWIGNSPGLEYALEGEASDASGNTAAFLASFYGFNPNVPRLVINELITQGTTDHPDMLEIKVLSNGDMGGVTLYQGTPGSFDDRLVFPSFPVRQGEFIVVHFKPSGDGTEINETSDTASSGGVDACATAYDFWVAGGRGISGNNGVLSVYQRPGGNLVDGVLYSNRNSTSDEKYLGFGSAAMLARAEEVVRDGGWRISGEARQPGRSSQSGRLHQHAVAVPLIRKRGYGLSSGLAHRSHAEGKLGPGQHGRGLRAVGDAVLLEHLLDDFLQGWAGKGADLLLDHLALVEEQERGDAHDIELGCKLGLLVHVYLGHFQLVLVLRREILEDRSNHLAGAAPFRPEIGYNGDR